MPSYDCSFMLEGRSAKSSPGSILPISENQHDSLDTPADSSLTETIGSAVQSSLSWARNIIFHSSTHTSKPDDITISATSVGTTNSAQPYKRYPESLEEWGARAGCKTLDEWQTELNTFNKKRYWSEGVSFSKDDEQKIPEEIKAIASRRSVD